MIVIAYSDRNGQDIKQAFFTPPASLGSLDSGGGVDITGQTIDLGEGFNEANITTSNFTTSTITSGSMRDVVNLDVRYHAFELDMNLGAGNNSITFDAGTAEFIDITTLGGNDELTFTSTGHADDFTLNLGAGNDTIGMTIGGTADRHDYDLADGNNVVTLDVGSLDVLDIQALGGDDTVSITAAGSAHNGTIGLGAGDDSFTLNAGGEANNYGITLGDGNNSVDVDTSSHARNYTITSGSGNDTYEFDVAGDATTYDITTGAGDDSITLNTTASGVANSHTIDMGDGTNTLDYTVANSATSFNYTGTNGIDTVTLTSGGHITDMDLTVGGGDNVVDIESTNGNADNFAFSAVGGDDTLNLDVTQGADDISILTAGGNDSVTVNTTTSMANASFNLGTGNNDLSLSGSITNITYTGGSNNDDITVTSGSVNGGIFNYGIGAGGLTVESAVTSFNNTTVTMGSGADSIVVSTAASGNSFSMGSGLDSLTLQSLGNNTVALGIQSNIVDELIITGSGAHDFSALGGQVTGTESLDFTNSQSNTITVDRSFAMQADNFGGDKIVFISGEASDTVDILSGTGTVTDTGASQLFNGVTYDIYQQAEGTNVFFFIDEDMSVTVDGGALSFENPFVDDLSDADMPIDASLAVAKQADNAGEVETIANDQADITLTYALWGQDGSARMDGDIAKSISAILAGYAAELQARGVNIAFVEAPVEEDASIYQQDNIDLNFALGNEIMGRYVDNPDDYLGLSAGQEGEAGSLLMNAPDAPDYVSAEAMAGSIFLSDAYLKLASMDEEQGGGVDAGSLAYYVIAQEIGHSLGLEEMSDAELQDMGYNPEDAHEDTVMDETLDGFESLDDIAGQEFADTLGEEGFDLLADMLRDHYNLGNTSDSGTSDDTEQNDSALIDDAGLVEFAQTLSSDENMIDTLLNEQWENDASAFMESFFAQLSDNNGGTDNAYENFSEAMSSEQGENEMVQSLLNYADEIAAEQVQATIEADMNGQNDGANNQNSGTASVMSDAIDITPPPQPEEPDPVYT